MAVPPNTAEPAASPSSLLLVDDEPSILSALNRVFRSQGYVIYNANSGREALAILEKTPMDVVISDMRMPEMDGAQFLEQVFTRWPETKRILLTGYADAASTIAAINRGKIWRFIAKPWNDEELLLTVQQALTHRTLLREHSRLTKLTQQQNKQLKELNASLEQKVAKRTEELAAALESLEDAHDKLRHGFMSTIQLFSSLIELRGSKLAGHSRNVANIARQVAERMGLSDIDQQDLLLAALLHDIGKIGLPDDLLNAPYNTLSPNSKAIVMRHPVKGQQVLTGVPQLAAAAKIIRHHHEYMDGSGYPDHLVGLTIPLGARILAVANDYDAIQKGSMMLHAYAPDEARQHIIKARGQYYDPAVVDVFISLFEEHPEELVKETLVRPVELKPGMILSRDLMHRDGYLLLEHGHVIDKDAMAQLMNIEHSDGVELVLHVYTDAKQARIREGIPDPVVETVVEQEVQSASSLKPGMVLTRGLRHKEGYLVLPQGTHIGDVRIKELLEYEQITGESVTVFVRM